MKREIWKLNLKSCKKNLWMQSDEYSQRALNNLCNCVTEPIGWRQYFCPPPSKWVLLWGKCNPYPPPEGYCSLLDTCRSFKFAASVVIGILHVLRDHCLSHFKNDQIWPILQQKTIPIVFELDPLFLIRVSPFRYNNNRNNGQKICFGWWPAMQVPCAESYTYTNQTSSRTT